MNKRHYEHTLPNIRGSLSNTYDKPNISIFTIPKYRSYEPSQMFHVAVTRTVEKKRQRQCFNIVPRELNTFLL